MSDDVQQKVTYSVDEDGSIHREQGSEKIRVGSYNRETQVLQLVDQYKNYRVAITRHLNANEMPYASVVVEGDALEVAKEEAVSIPPRPKKHPVYGDKTPALVEWYETYRPAEFRAKYGVLGPKLANGKWPAARATHRTEKVPEHDVEGDVDWDADLSAIEGGKQ